MVWIHNPSANDFADFFFTLDHQDLGSFLTIYYWVCQSLIPTHWYSFPQLLLSTFRGFWASLPGSALIIEVDSADDALMYLYLFLCLCLNVYLYLYLRPCPDAAMSVLVAHLSRANKLAERCKGAIIATVGRQCGEGARLSLAKFNVRRPEA